MSVEKKRRVEVDGYDVPSDLHNMLEEVISFASTNGLIVMKDYPLFTHAPFTMFPSCIPKYAFEEIQLIAADLNILYDRISRDREFLYESLKEVAENDEFVSKQLNILKKADENRVQHIQLCINRSDYMLQQNPDGSKQFYQVEMNTMSASFGALSTVVSKMHRFISARHFSNLLDVDRLPVHNTKLQIATALGKACRMNPNKNAVVLMIVQPGEKNIADQRWLEYGLWEYSKVSLIRKTLKQIHDHAYLSPTHDLMIDEMVIGVTYFRAGYTPRDYPTEHEWDALLKIEQSKSIMCPSTAYHLAGTKKIQQVLSEPNVIERFVSKECAERVRKCFAGLWSLSRDDEEIRQVITDAINNPSNYVVKPQREGGGNNIWGEDLKEFLQTSSIKKRSAYILMQRIQVMKNINALVRNAELAYGICESEVGIFGAYLSDEKTEYHNKLAGHLMRTKRAGTNEGGVATGYAVLDSPYLTDV